jgi:hypothetical protein
LPKELKRREAELLSSSGSGLQATKRKVSSPSMHGQSFEFSYQLDQVKTDNKDLRKELDALKTSKRLLEEGKREVNSFPTHDHSLNHCISSNKLE